MKRLLAGCVLLFSSAALGQIPLEQVELQALQAQQDRKVPQDLKVLPERRAKPDPKARQARRALLGRVALLVRLDRPLQVQASSVSRTGWLVSPMQVRTSPLQRR